MPDTRKHRGPGPEDEKLFEHRRFIDLKAAVKDMSMLLTRGYPETGTLKLVGDRYNLQSRQRIVVMRSSCSDGQLYERDRSCLRGHQLKDEKIAVDGFNILITVEALLAGGYIFIGRDGCYRDISSVHSTYRRVEETLRALKMICVMLSRLRVGSVVFYLDQPVSNSGKLKQFIELFFEKNRLNWSVSLVDNPDEVLKNSDDVVISSDSNIINGCFRWFNLMRFIDEHYSRNEDTHILDLS